MSALAPATVASGGALIGAGAALLAVAIALIATDRRRLPRARRDHPGRRPPRLAVAVGDLAGPGPDPLAVMPRRSARPEPDPIRARRPWRLDPPRSEPPRPPQGMPPTAPRGPGREPGGGPGGGPGARALPAAIRVVRGLPPGARFLVGLAACAVLAEVSGIVPAQPVGVGLVAAGVLAGARHGRAAGIRRRQRRRQSAAASGVVDLLGAALLAGLNGHLALLRVAERVPPALHAEFRLVAADLRLGRTPAAALSGAADRTGLAELRAAAGALHAAERWGAPAADALAARSDALRTRLRLDAEAAAGRAAVKLAFPLVLCFLPAFVLLTVVPLVVGAVRAAGF